MSLIYITSIYALFLLPMIIIISAVIYILLKYNYTINIHYFLDVLVLLLPGLLYWLFDLLRVSRIFGNHKTLSNPIVELFFICLITIILFILRLFLFKMMKDNTNKLYTYIIGIEVIIVFMIYSFTPSIPE